MSNTIKDIMCCTPTYIAPTATIQQAAQKMQELNCGFLPVGENDKLTGVVTDRDIATRACAQGYACDTAVSKIISSKVLYCYETDSIETVAQNMAENQVRRLVVLNNKDAKRLVGVVSVCDIATATSTKAQTSHTLISGVSACKGNCATKNKAA